MMKSIDYINVTSYGIHVLLLSIFHLIVKVGGCVVEENMFNMNTRTYGLVHCNLGLLTSQKIFYIHQLSTLCILSSSAQQRVPMEYYYVRKWNVCTSRYLDVVATFIVVISDLDSRFSGIDFQIFNCVARLRT